MSNSFDSLNKSVLDVMNGNEEVVTEEEITISEMVEYLTEEEVDQISILFEKYDNGEITEEELEEGLWSAAKAVGRGVAAAGKAVGRGIKKVAGLATPLGRAELRSKLDDRKKAKLNKKWDKEVARNTKIQQKQDRMKELEAKRKKDAQGIKTMKRNIQKTKEVNPTVGMKTKSAVKTGLQKAKDFVVSHYEHEHGITLSEEEVNDLMFNYILNEKIKK